MERLVSIALATGLLASACAATPQQASPPRAAAGHAPVVVPAPARPAPTVCIGCGLVSAREPADLPRWKYTVQMDDGTTSLVFVDPDPRLQVGARVRVAGGRLEPVAASN